MVSTQSTPVINQAALCIGHEFGSDLGPSMLSSLFCLFVLCFGSKDKNAQKITYKQKPVPIPTDKHSTRYNIVLGVV